MYTRVCNIFFCFFFQTEQSYMKNPKPLNQFQYCENYRIPFAVVIGQSELENNVVTFRNIATREEVCINCSICSTHTHR